MTIAQPLNQTTACHEVLLTGDWQVCSVPFSSSGITASGEWMAVLPDSTHLQPALYPDRPYWGQHLRQINESAWLYQRSFTIPAPSYQRVRLRFEGVDYYASVWVNGQHAADHEGNFAPFDVDITRFIRPGYENTLTVRVSSPWDTPNPRGTYPIDHVVRGMVKGLYEHGEGLSRPM